MQLLVFEREINMRLMRIAMVFGFLFGFLTVGWADNQSFSWFSVDNNKQVTIPVDMFLSSTCPHCEKANAFFNELETKYPWLAIRRHVINQDKVALETYHQFLQKLKLSDFAVPAIFFCNTRWVGFVDAQTSGKQLVKSLNFCRDQIAKTGELSTTTVEILNQMSTANWYEENLQPQLSPFVFIPIMAIVDTLNPLSLFIILTLFSFLFIERQKKTQIGTTLLFLLSVGLAHHIQQIHTEFFYQILPMLRFPVIAIGVGLITYVFYLHPKVFSVRRTLPAIISFILAMLTGFFVQVYQQIHTPNFSLIFHQWVMTQNLTVFWQLMYSLIYQLIYVLALGLITGGLIALIKYYGNGSQHQRRVGEFAWQYLIIIGLILIVYPVFFASIKFSFVAFVMALLTSWMSFKMWTKRST